MYQLCHHYLSDDDNTCYLLHTPHEQAIVLGIHVKYLSISINFQYCAAWERLLFAFYKITKETRDVESFI